MKNRKVLPGEEIIVPNDESIYLVCCDCGLTHVAQATIKDNSVTLKFWRHNRKTAGLRRYNNFLCTKTEAK